MTQSLHNKLQKIEADIVALELKQQYLKDRISRRVMAILDQEQAFAMDPPLLFGAIIEAVQQLKKLGDASDEKSRLKRVGEAFLRKRPPSLRKVDVPLPKETSS